MSRSSTVTASDSRRRRFAQADRAVGAEHVLRHAFFISALSVCAKVCSTWRLALVNLP